MPGPPKIDKEDILSQLKKEGVTDLDSFVQLLLKNSHQDGDLGKPVVNSVMLFTHGFMKH